MVKDESLHELVEHYSDTMANTMANAVSPPDGWKIIVEPDELYKEHYRVIMIPNTRKTVVRIHTSIHTSIHTYIHTSIHPYIHTSIHPYIHPYIEFVLFIYSQTFFLVKKIGIILFGLRRN